MFGETQTQTKINWLYHMTIKNNKNLHMKKIVASVLIAMSLNSYCQNTITDDGISSPIHQKYLSKIVYASDSKSLSNQSEIETNFKTEFNIGEPIYFRVYLANSLTNYMIPLVKNQTAFTISHNSTFLINYYLDNEYLESLTEDKLGLTEFESEEKDKWTTFKGALKPINDANTVGKEAFNEIIKKYETKLTIGKHQLKMEVLPIYTELSSGSKEIKGNIIATGIITLNVKGNIIDSNDPTICLPTSNMVDNALEKNISKAYLRDFKINPDVIRILSSKWEIERNKYTDVIIKRKLDVSIGFKENGVCYKRIYQISQQYIGTSFSGELTFTTSNQNPKYDINCKCLISNQAVKK